MQWEVRDLLGDFAAYWQTAAGLDFTDREAAWGTLYESLHPDVFDHYFETWGSREELLPQALDNHEGELLLRRGMELRAVLEPAARRACEVLGVSDVPLRFVLMVGLFRADGWTHRLDGKETVFFCLEQLEDRDAYAAMVVHETAHVLHSAVRAGEWPE